MPATIRRQSPFPAARRYPLSLIPLTSLNGWRNCVLWPDTAGSPTKNLPNSVPQSTPGLSSSAAYIVLGMIRKPLDCLWWLGPAWRYTGLVISRIEYKFAWNPILMAFFLFSRLSKLSFFSFLFFFCFWDSGGEYRFLFEMGFVNFKNYRLYILTATAYMGSLLFG